MSARLLGLAFGARMPSLAAKVVLLKLVDCCDDDGRNIFPSVATLANAAECAERTVQRVLKLFCAIGLLRMVREGGSGKGNTRCYELDVDLLFNLRKPGVFAELEARNGGIDDAAEGAENGTSHAQDACEGENCGEASAALRVTPCHPNSADRVTLTTPKGDTMSPNPLIETSISERESASERREEKTPDGEPCVARGAGLGGSSDAEGETQHPAATLDHFRKVWPNVATDDQTKLANAWAELPFPLRQAAIAGVPGFLAELKAAKRACIPASWKYIGERRWTLVAAQAAERKAETGQVEIKAWSQVWWAVLLRRLKAGERCGLMAKWAIEGKSWSVVAKETPGAAELAALHPFECTGPEIAAWRGWFRAKGVELPTFKGQCRVFLPSPAPPGAAANQASGF